MKNVTLKFELLDDSNVLVSYTAGASTFNAAVGAEGVLDCLLLQKFAEKAAEVADRIDQDEAKGG